MSQSDTVALIKRYYEAFNRDDVNAMTDCLADNVVHDVNQGVRRPGKEAFRIFCAHMSQCYNERLQDVVIMTSSDGARASAEFNVRGTYLTTDTGLPPATGQKYALPAGTFFAVHDGKITRITTYYNLTDWLMQVTGDAK